MKKYKILSVNEAPGQQLCVELKRHGFYRVCVPVEYRSDLHVGGTLRIHHNIQNHQVAYSFGNKIYFLMRPLARPAMVQFIGNFADTASMSMDSMCFKYVLARALLAHGGWPRFDAVKNLEMYMMLDSKLHTK